jgi:hypothetical protein
MSEQQGNAEKKPSKTGHAYDREQSHPENEIHMREELEAHRSFIKNLEKSSTLRVVSAK